MRSYGTFFILYVAVDLSLRTNIILPGVKYKFIFTDRGMNPQYMNPGLPQGNRGPPASQSQPPISYPNGPLPYNQRPVGPPGQYGGPVKPDPGGQGPGSLMHNGPGGGPQGEPNTMRNGFPHGQFQQPAGPPGNMGISRPVTTGPPANNFATAPSSGRGVPLQNNFMPHQPQGLGPPSGGSSGNPPPVGPPRPPGPGQITSQMGAMNLGPQGVPPAVSSPHNQAFSAPSSMANVPPMSQPGLHPPPPGAQTSGAATSMMAPPPTSMPPLSSHATGPQLQPGQRSLPGHLGPPGPQGQIGPPVGPQGQIGPPPGPQGQMGPPPGPQVQVGPPSGPQSRMTQPGPPSAFNQPMMNSGSQQPMGYNTGPPIGGAQPPASMPPSPNQQPPAQGGVQFGYPGSVPRAPTPIQQQPQPRKLDPDQMPSPIQVIEDDKQNRAGVFNTSARGSVPPLVTTKFTVEDQGNASPRFLRSTMYNVPVSQDILKTAHIPFAMTYTPFARLEDGEHPPPIVDLGQLGPIRCNRCKAYMCPYMQFIDGGRRFQCAFCNCATDVATEYFAHLDHTGRRTDCYERPELCLGTYEFVATTDYCKDNKLPNPPAFIFMIDVSYNSVKSGLVNLMCTHLKENILYNLPKETGADESEIRVGFVTYHRELHFYNVKGALAQPQMMIVSDIEDVFVPLLDGFLVKLSESEAVIDSLLGQIPQMFSESRETEIVLGPVIQAGLDALKSADCAGKIFIFHSSLPVAQAPGALKNRDDRKLLGTEKEKSVLTPQSNFYTKLGQECVSAGCSVELFLFPNSYIDVASVSEVSRLTGGSVHKYQYFQADLDGKRFLDDLRRNVEKPIAFDGIMRVRTSTGIRPVDFYGNFYMSNTTDVELATIDCDKAITVEIKHDDKLSEAEGAYTQAAILYTSVSGQRRLRIINLAFNCCTQMADLFRNCELDTLVNFMSKHALRQTLNGSPKQVREHIMNQCAQILACYRQKCASPSSPGQLILPECMKLLPVYSNCVIKSSMLQGGGDISTDDRSWLMFLANAMTVKNSHVYFYPRLLPLHQLDLDSEDFPPTLRCSYERLQDNGAYILENGLTMIMWVGMNISQNWVQDVFGVHSVAQIDIDKTKLQTLDNPLSRRIRDIVSRIREERQKYLKLIIVRQRDKLEPLFQQYLVEDRGVNGTASYVDFLCHIHKEIRSLLS